MQKNYTENGAIAEPVKHNTKKDNFWMRLFFSVIAMLLVMGTTLGAVITADKYNTAHAASGNTGDYITPTSSNLASNFYPYGIASYGIDVPTNYNAIKYLYYGDQGNYYVFYEQDGGFVLYHVHNGGSQSTTIVNQSSNHFPDGYFDGSIFYDAYIYNNQLVIAGFSGDDAAATAGIGAYADCKRVFIELGTAYTIVNTDTLRVDAYSNGYAYKNYGDLVFMYSTNGRMHVFDTSLSTSSYLYATDITVFASKDNFNASSIIAYAEYGGAKYLLWEMPSGLYSTAITSDSSAPTAITFGDLLPANKHIIGLVGDRVQVVSASSVSGVDYDVVTYGYSFDTSANAFTLGSAISNYGLILPHGIANSSVVHVVPSAGLSQGDYVVMLGQTSNLTLNPAHTHIPVFNAEYASQWEAYTYQISAVGATTESCCMETNLNTYNIDTVIRLGDDLQNVSALDGLVVSWAPSTIGTGDANKIIIGNKVSLNVTGTNSAYDFVGWAIYNGAYTSIDQYSSAILDAGAKYIQQTPTANTTYVALFTQATPVYDPITIINAPGANGSMVMDSGNPTTNTPITFTASTNYNYKVGEWAINGTVMQTGGETFTHTFTEAGEYTVSVNFVRDVTKTTTINGVPVNSEMQIGGANIGTVSVSGVLGSFSPFYAGDIILLDAMTASGFNVEGWYISYNGGATYTRIDNSLIASNGYYMISKENVQLSTGNIVFAARIVYGDGSQGSGILTVTTERALPNGNDAGTVSLGGTYQIGQTVTLTATVNSGYTWQGWHKMQGGQWVKVSDELTYSFVVTLADTQASPYQFRGWFGGGNPAGGVDIESWTIKDHNGNIIQHGDTIGSINGEASILAVLTPSNATEVLIFTIISGDGEVTLATKDGAVIKCYSQYVGVRAFCESTNTMQEFTIYSATATGFEVKHIINQVTDGKSINVSGGDANLTIKLIPSNANDRVIIEVIDGDGSATEVSLSKWTISGEGAVKFKAYLENNPENSITFTANFSLSWWDNIFSGLFDGLGSLGNILKWGIIILAVVAIGALAFWLIGKIILPLILSFFKKK